MEDDRPCVVADLLRIIRDVCPPPRKVPPPPTRKERKQQAENGDQRDRRDALAQEKELEDAMGEAFPGIFVGGE